MFVRSNSAVAAIAVALPVIACGGVIPLRIVEPLPSLQQMAQLRVDPGDVPRDVFWGVGGETYAPPADAVCHVNDRTDNGMAPRARPAPQETGR